MVKSAIKWLSWSSVAVTVFFIFFAFAAIKNLFDRPTADMLARWTAALIFLLGAALLCCIMIDYGEAEEEDE